MTNVTADAPHSTYGIEAESKTADSCDRKVMLFKEVAAEDSFVLLIVS